MKYLFILIIILLIVGCGNENFNNDFRKAVIAYQEKVPIPKNDKIAEPNENKYFYLVYFSLKDGDTLFKILRRNSGITINDNVYGIYQDSKLSPMIVSDKHNLAKYVINKKIKNKLLHGFIIEDSTVHYLDFPPVYTYIIKNKEIKLKSIDTISDYWAK